MQEETKITKLDILKELLAKHDFYYNYSDDYRVWKQGEAEYKAIQDLRKDIFLNSKELWEEAEAIWTNYLKKYSASN